MQRNAGGAEKTQKLDCLLPGKFAQEAKIPGNSNAEGRGEKQELGQ
jgi:hypothetical protein